MLKFVEREYTCKICSKVHKVKLSAGLLEGRAHFPFAHTFLHGELKNLLTILYLDQDLEVRGADVQNLSIDDDNLFSKDQATSIVENLMREIERLRDENEKISAELSELKLKNK